MADVQKSLEGIDEERTIFRVPHDRNRPYTVVNKESAEDPAFEGVAWMAARHMLTIMLGMPDDWDFNLRELATRCRINKDVAGTLARLLIRAGYIVRAQGRRNSGRFGRIRYLVYERPITVSALDGHGGHRVCSHRTRSDRDPVEPCPVRADILSNQEDPPTPLPDPRPSKGGTKDAPPAAAPDPGERELPSAAVVLDAMDQVHREVRGRSLPTDRGIRQTVGRLLKGHKADAIVTAWRRALRAAPGTRKAYHVLQDLEIPTPASPQKQCRACGAVLVSGSCLQCGIDGEHGPSPPATPEEVVAALQELPWRQPKGAHT